MREFLFAVFLLFFFEFTVFGQCPPPPESLKSAQLTYIPLVDSPSANFRFFYTVTAECGHLPNASALYITTPLDQADDLTLYWQLDSLNKVTGVIDPCVVLPAAPCYTVYYYHADAILTFNAAGYTAVTYNCCRPYDAKNLTYGLQIYYTDGPPIMTKCLSNDPGPGAVDNAIASFVKVPMNIINSSPKFISNDTILFICKNQPFLYKVSAIDPDGDSLVYHFSTPRTQMIIQQGFGTGIRTTPAFPVANFRDGYSSSQPAGKDISINSSSGIIQGTISDTGTYVITVSATEYRNQILLDSITQDLLVRVYDCDSLLHPKASVPSPLDNCNSFTVNFPNNSVPLYSNVNWNNTTYLWDFGDGGSSQLLYPTHIYADTGVYTIRLIVFPGLHCADTAFGKVLVYPFLRASLSYTDSCSNQQIQFVNNSSSAEGSIDYTKWKFLLGNTIIDSSSAYNTQYLFTKAPQTYAVLLTVGTDKGCMATDTQYISVFKSPYPLDSHDTILSRGTVFQLHARDGTPDNSGQFWWTPSLGLNNPDIPDPIVNSTTDTTYIVSIKNKYGCTLVDSIHIKYYSGPDIYVPNAFTPNGDGKNDIFRPIPVGISHFKYFRVFNRYGQLVFETEQPFKGWDGYFNGQPASGGAYVWETAGIDYENRLILKKGTVILIR